jgi:hypothetical protein
VVEERAVVGRDAWEIRTTRVPVRQRRCLQKRHALVQDAGIAGRAHVVSDDVRKPEQVVGTSGTEASTTGLVPPVLDVAFDELP